MLCLLRMKKINTVSLLKLEHQNHFGELQTDKSSTVYSYISSCYTSAQHLIYSVLKKKNNTVKELRWYLCSLGSLVLSHDDTRTAWEEFPATTPIDRDERHSCVFVHRFSLHCTVSLPFFLSPTCTLSYPRAASHSVAHAELIRLESQTHRQRKGNDGCYNKQSWKIIAKGTFSHDVIPKTFPLIKGSTVHKLVFPSS